MSDGTIEVEVKGGKVSEFTLAALYFQLEDLEHLMSDQAMSHTMRCAMGVVQVREMKADVRKRVAEAMVAQARGAAIVQQVEAELKAEEPT